MMKNFLAYFLAFGILLFLNGCVKDQCKKTFTYTISNPVYKTKAEVKANIKSNAPQPIVNPGKIYLSGNYIFLNEINKGIHIIDNSTPANPRNVSFIDIPGNLDLAVKGNALYADLYTDLVVLDISNPVDVVVKKFDEGVFPYRYYSSTFLNDTSKIIVDWINRDTTIEQNCNYEMYYYDNNSVISFSSAESGSNKANSSPTGIGGSMARFAVVKNTLYTVSTSDLNVFNISSAFDPQYKNKTNLGNWQIETIFPMKDKLFIGSQNGMYIYDIADAEKPVSIGKFGHVQSCDPVIADDQFAYVTLRSGTACQGFTNQMEILNIADLSNPSLVKTYSFTNPHGLSKDGDLLFICDGMDGLKVYNAADVNNLQLKKHFDIQGAFDVIAYNNIAMVVANDGLYQYDYSDKNKIHLVSKLNIQKQY